MAWTVSRATSTRFGEREVTAVTEVAVYQTALMNLRRVTKIFQKLSDTTPFKI